MFYCLLIVITKFVITWFLCFLFLRFRFGHNLRCVYFTTKLFSIQTLKCDLFRVQKRRDAVRQRGAVGVLVRVVAQLKEDREEKKQTVLMVLSRTGSMLILTQHSWATSSELEHVGMCLFGNSITAVWPTCWSVSWPACHGSRCCLSRENVTRTLVFPW